MKVKESVAGSVLVHGEDGTAHFLMPGDEVPQGVTVDKSLVDEESPAGKRKARTNGTNKR